MNYFKYTLLLLFLALQPGWSEVSYAQNKPALAPGRPPVTTPASAPAGTRTSIADPNSRSQKPVKFAPGEQVELIKAGSLEGIKSKTGDEVRKFKGNVVFKQKETYLYCDSALQYPVTNNIEAFSNVRITQGDTVTLTGDSLHYNGNTRYAQVWGNVVLRDRSMTLTTTSLDYDLNTSMAAYYNNGRIVDKENTLTSIIGLYNTKTKLFTFKNEVVVVNPKYTVTSDTLQYNSFSRLVFLKGPSKIVGKDGTLYANDGVYNTATQVSNFQGRAQVDYGKYTLIGDHLYYDKVNEVGFAEGNVESYSKEDKITVYGDFGRYWGKNGITKVYGNALMKNADDEGDTLYLAADTLVSIENKIDSTKRMLGYYNVKIYKTNLQGKCDSLVYNFSDSTIYFFRDPVLWNEKNQMEADSMHIQLANNKIDKLFMRVNSFVISEDTLHDFNQVKGRTITAFFNKQSKIDHIHVDGNGESLYFALDDKDTSLIGMNRVECSRMVIRFKQNKLNKISFITKPDALFIPPHEIEEPAKRLRGFAWRIQEKPTEEQVVYRRRKKPVKEQKPAEVSARKPVPAGRAK